MDNKPEIILGSDKFQDIRREPNAYYIDKSLFIKHIIDNKSAVTLITRPRRFGKTMNMSMLDCFFNIDYDYKKLFNGLKIMDEGEQYTKYLNNVPTVFLSLKGARATNYEKMINVLKGKFASLYREYRYLTESDKLASDEINYINNVLNGNINEFNLILSNLCEFLSKHYDEKQVLILIDEYDVPLQEAYKYGFYDELVTDIKSMFEEVFKGNRYVLKAVVTGVTRITKEGIFTVANNFDVYSVLKSNKFYDDFGFTKEEVITALTDFKLEKHEDEVKAFYDGYRIGEAKDIYNPWSILKFLIERRLDTYWVSVSSNDMVERLIEKNTYVDIKDSHVLCTPQ